MRCSWTTYRQLISKKKIKNVQQFAESVQSAVNSLGPTQARRMLH